MTKLIANQRISRRTATRIRIEARHIHLPRIKLPTLKTVEPAFVYTAVITCAVIVVFILIGGAMSLNSGAGIDPGGLPQDHSAARLLGDFVALGATVGPLELGTTPPVGELPSGFEPVPYTVKRGDTVSEIAADYDLRVDTIVSYNRITDVRSVQAGSVLLIPAYESGTVTNGVLHTVQRGDSLLGIANRYDVDLNPILDANQLASDVIQPGQVLFIPEARMNSVALRRALGTLFVKPVVGRLTSDFGMRIDPISGRRSMHYGVDWANARGTPIRASNHGRVSMVGESNGLGKYIIIDHVDQYQSLYAHLSSWSVREGMDVNQGTIIGKVGNTGYSTGPHLHFAIYSNYEPVDPLDYIH